MDTPIKSENGKSAVPRDNFDPNSPMDGDQKRDRTDISGAGTARLNDETGALHLSEAKVTDTPDHGHLQAGDKNGDTDINQRNNSHYLVVHLGKALQEALAEICERRPMDPIEYLAQWLHRYSYNLEQARKEAELANRLDMEVKEAAVEADRRATVLLECKHIREEEERQKMLFLQREQEIEQENSDALLSIRTEFQESYECQSEQDDNSVAVVPVGRTVNKVGASTIASSNKAIKDDRVTINITGDDFVVQDNTGSNEPADRYTACRTETSTPNGQPVLYTIKE